MSVRRAFVGLVLAVMSFTTACQPTFLLPAPSTPCYVGVFALKAEQFTASVSTPIGPVTLALVPGGSVGLTITSDGHWSLGGTETVSVSGAFVGQATAEGAASGTYTESGGTFDFAVGNLNGSATIDGTFNGQPVHLNLAIPGSWVDKVIGLQGHASYTCAGSGLSLSFTSLRLDF